MKRKLAYVIAILIAILTFLLLEFAAWKYFTSTQREENTPIEENLRIDMHEQGHRDNKVINMDRDQIRKLDIQTQYAHSGEMVVHISTRGKIILHPDRLLHVLPKISGIAKEAFQNIGDVVEPESLLAILESREMADAKASYLAAMQKLSLMTALLEREKRLHEKKVSAEQDYLNAKSAHAEARINLQLTEQKLRAFGVSQQEIHALATETNPDLRLYEIRSPMKGVVIARHITKGEFIENTTTIYEIADLSTIWVEIGIYPKDLIKVQKGQLVDIFLPDGKIAPAKIIYLSPIIQDETITAKGIAELPNSSENWRPGSFVKVNIATEKVTVPILIPKEAYQVIEGKNYVFVKVPPGFEKRQVQLGSANDFSVEVLSGLNPGEEYAASNTFWLKADLSKEEAEHEHR